MTTEEIESVDTWRAQQRGLPSRPEAIRQLIALGLEAAARQKEKA